MGFWLACVALGLFTGFSAGMLGIGGGLVMVPILVMIFSAQTDVASADVLHMALGTSMAVILFTSLSSLRAHHRHGAVLWKVVLQITPGILLGTATGTLFAAKIPAKPLAMFFTGFVCLVAVQMLLEFKPKPTRELPGAGGVLLVGSVIGVISSLVAIGGGALTVPFLSWCNVKVQKAIGTSAAVGFPIAFGGALGYVMNGIGRAGLPGWSYGFVYLPALMAIVPFSMLTAPMGARLTHRLPVATIKRLFAGLLFALAARMSWKLLS